MTISKANLDLELRTNHVLQANIWEALREEVTLQSLDLDGLSIKVQNGEVYLDGYLEEEHQPLVESTIQSVHGVVEIHNRLRTNDGILGEIWDGLWKVDTFRSQDLGSLSISVNDGEVSLNGHLSQQNDLPLIERFTRSVAGVVAVRNHLVADHDLTVQVAQALARDERTRAFILPVNASHGWIYLGGEVPTHEHQRLVEKITAEVTGVRGVIGLPRVTGENPAPRKPALQPRIGASVYGRDREEGVVTQVVIQPNDQRVTHVVVRFKELRNGNLVARETVIPIEACDLVKVESIFLARNGPTFSAFPAFDPDEYPLAPYTWKAPYPYTAGEVRWSLSQLYEAQDTPSETSLEPVSSQRMDGATRMNSAWVSV